MRYMRMLQVEDLLCTCKMKGYNYKFSCYIYLKRMWNIMKRIVVSRQSFEGETPEHKSGALLPHTAARYVDLEPVWVLESRFDSLIMQ
jgi:hypothetical protein